MRIKRDRLISLTRITSGKVRSWPLEGTRTEDPVAAAINSERAGFRVVLTCAHDTIPLLAESIARLRESEPTLTVAVLLDWQAALSWHPDSNSISTIETVYVHADQEVDRASIEKIEAQWTPIWIITPLPNSPWTTWVTNTLLPTQNGSLVLFQPSFSDFNNPTLSLDQLCQDIVTLGESFPLIQLRSPPAEWFAPDELATIENSCRDLGRAQICFDGRSPLNNRSALQLSVVVPFRYTGAEGEVARLHRCLKSVKSCIDAWTMHAEIVIVIDRDVEIPLPDGLQDAEVLVIDLPRSYSSDDYRKGFLRNCGAHFSRVTGSGSILFIDPDITISSPDALAPTLRGRDWHIAYVGEPEFSSKASSASSDSKLVLVKPRVFRALGGFADSFSRPGYEVCQLAWAVRNWGGRQLVIDPAAIVNDHEAQKSNATAVGSDESAKLFYRMTLSRDAYDKAFLVLGRRSGIRSLVSFVCASWFSRLSIGPLALVILRWWPFGNEKELQPILWFLKLRVDTEYELSRQPQYWQGAISGSGHNLEHLLNKANQSKLAGRYISQYWWLVRAHLWRLKIPYYLCKANLWRLAAPYHFMKKHLWRVPNFFAKCASQIWTFVIIAHAKLRAKQYGWLPIQWRLQLAAVRVAGATKLLWATTIVRAYHEVRLHFWRVTAPYHFMKKHLWRVPNLFAKFASQIWTFVIVAHAKLRAKQYGWLPIQWRLHLAAVRVAGATKLLWAATIVQFYHLIHLHIWRVPNLFAKFASQIWTFVIVAHAKLRAKQYGWLPIQWRLQLAAVRVAGATKLLWAATIVQFYHFIHLHIWRVPLFANRIWSILTEPWRKLKGNAWALREPSAWLQIHGPMVYKLIWRPLLKLRYFFEFQFRTRILRRPSTEQ